MQDRCPVGPRPPGQLYPPRQQRISCRGVDGRRYLSAGTEAAIAEPAGDDCFVEEPGGVAGDGGLLAEPCGGAWAAVDELFGFAGEHDVLGSAIVGPAELGDGGDGRDGCLHCRCLPTQVSQDGEDRGPGGVGVGERGDDRGGGGEVEVAFAADELAGEGGDGAGEAVGDLGVGQGCGRHRGGVLGPAELAAGCDGRLHPDQPRIVERDA